MCKHYPGRDNMDCHACHDEVAYARQRDKETAESFNEAKLKYDIFWRMTTKPPIDIKSQCCWVGERLDLLIQVMRRYQQVGKPIPTEWLDEFNNHIEWLKDNNQAI